MICLCISLLFLNFMVYGIYGNQIFGDADPRFQQDPVLGPSDSENRDGDSMGYPRGNPSPDFYEQRAQPSELYDLEEKLTRAGKWPEFLQKLKEQGDKVGPGNIKKNWEQDVYKWAEYARGLKDMTVSTTTRRPYIHIAEPRGQPALGMDAYWSREEKSMPPPSNSLRSGPHEALPQMVSGQQMMDLALKKMEAFEKKENPPSTPPPDVPQQPRLSLSPNPVSQSDMMKMMLKKIELLEIQLNEQRDKPKTESPNTLPGFPPEQSKPILREADSSKDLFKDLPRVDDFNAPIRWVKYNSNETEDGLAKVTDLQTGTNRQYLLDGVFYVPISDYGLERLGFTTAKPTTPQQALLFTTEKNILRTVMNNMDLKAADERDWLAFDTILGGEQDSPICDGEKCQSRCHTMGCQSMCSGDTCASGCVGPACNSFCKGPGCLSMCIGDSCNARCDGLSCDARCRGNNCEANCNQFSCYYTVNGAFKRGSGTFDQWYSDGSRAE